MSESIEMQGLTLITIPKTADELNIWLSERCFCMEGKPAAFMEFPNSDDPECYVVRIVYDLIAFITLDTDEAGLCKEIYQRIKKAIEDSVYWQDPQTKPILFWRRHFSIDKHGKEIKVSGRLSIPGVNLRTIFNQDSQAQYVNR